MILGMDAGDALHDISNSPCDVPWLTALGGGGCSCRNHSSSGVADHERGENVFGFGFDQIMKRSCMQKIVVVT